MQHFLEARSLSVDFPRAGRVLNEFSCRFTSGELSVVTGQNGSGKTALLRSLRGLLKPEQGTVLLDAQPIPLRDPELAKKIAFVPQNPLASVVGSTVREDIMLGTSGTSDADREKIVSIVLDRFSLTPYADRKPHEIPFGRQKLLSFAEALSGDPVFLLVDDPFAGLDLSATQTVLRELLALKDRGTSVVVATLDIDRILAHANHLILIKDGRSIADALPERVLPFLEAHGVRKPNAKLQDMTWLNQ